MQVQGNQLRIMDRMLEREAETQERSRHHAASHRAQHQLGSAVQVHFLHNSPAMVFTM